MLYTSRMRYLWALIVSATSIVVAVSSCGSNGHSTAGHTNSAGSSMGGHGAGGHGAGTGTGGSTISGFMLDGGNGDGSTCTGAVTCQQVGATCGAIGDGCGGVLMCGTCPSNETCSGMPSVCSAPMCTPKTCAGMGINCGPAGDGCGGTLDCGMCTTPGDTCGGGGMPSVCGQSTMMCVPQTCAGKNISCGPAGDGCGGTLDCGSCTGNNTCGGGGTSGVCGAPPCIPKTCGTSCGPVADGCGNLLMCGGCNAPQTCGGGGTASVCGTSATCTNLCLQQVTCPNPAVTTTVSGTVFAPGHVGDPPFPQPGSADPLVNALVYIPNAAVLPFTPGVSCDNCGASASGSPLVSDVTGTDGKFMLKNVPVGANIPLVIQLGRWRRQITISNVAACQDNPLAADQTRLPRNKSEGDIPLMAFATGAVDSLECVIRKIGVDDAEFTVPAALGGNGRVQIYTGTGQGGVTALGDGNPGEDQLWSNPAVLNQYDMLLFPCQGGQFDKGAAAQQNVIDYANAGGRIFATHYSYVWLYNDAPFSSTASWNPNQTGISQDPQTGFIDTTFPKGLALAQWLVNVGAASTLGQIQLQTLRRDINNSGVVPPAQMWMSLNDPSAGNVPMHYTFNTPVGAPAAQQCGRVLYDDFHVEDNSTFPMEAFPTECTSGPMTPQEKLLEFMLFDLGSCVTPDIPMCTPKTCVQIGASCGPAGDGCGGIIQCGPCPAGQTCGGGGMPSVCGGPMCTPKTCAQQSIQCGPAGDGCGGLVQCGTCPAGQTCGGGNMPGKCGNQMCTPKTCVQENIQCGPAGDGCGGLIQCGACPPGQSCGGGGMPGICGGTMCTPKTCVQLGANCGPVADGCGGILQCGVCMVPQTCGGGGMASVCGGNGPH